MLANTPVNGTKYKLGQAMTVASNDVEDWMVRTSDQIYGGYTARYRSRTAEGAGGKTGRHVPGLTSAPGDRTSAPVIFGQQSAVS